MLNWISLTWCCYVVVPPHGSGTGMFFVHFRYVGEVNRFRIGCHIGINVTRHAMLAIKIKQAVESTTRMQTNC